MRGSAYGRELDGTWGGDQLYEVLKYGGFHLVIIEVVFVVNEKVNFISIKMASG